MQRDAATCVPLFFMPRFEENLLNLRPNSAVTRTTITTLMEQLQRTLSDTSAGMYLREIKSIYNMAVNDESIELIDTHPFKNIKIPKGKKREIALTIAEAKAIYKLPVETKTEQVAKDTHVTQHGVKPHAA